MVNVVADATRVAALEGGGEVLVDAAYLGGVVDGRDGLTVRSQERRR